MSKGVKNLAALLGVRREERRKLHENIKAREHRMLITETQR